MQVPAPPAGQDRAGRPHAMLDGRLSLTTPEGVRLLLTPAGPHMRALAWLIDFLLWLLAVWMVRLVLPDNEAVEGIFMIFLFISYWGYSIICEVYFGGRSPGKRATGLEVVRSDGLPVGWAESTLRTLLLVADFMPVAYASGLVCMMCDRRFRRIGDMVAGTQVIYRERSVKRRDTPPAAPLAPPFPLNADQQRTLAALIEREYSLPPERLAELGTIAEPLTGRTGADSVEMLRRYVAGFSQ
ncbi:MAG: RDD family protein [Massilia sp.]